MAIVEEELAVNGDREGDTESRAEGDDLFSRLFRKKLIDLKRVSTGESLVVWIVKESLAAGV